MRASPVIDAHAHLGSSVYGEHLDVDALIPTMDVNGIDVAVVTAFTPPELDFVGANREVAEAIRAYPNRLLGAVRVDPRFASASDVIREAATTYGFRGLALHPAEQGVPVNDPLIFPCIAVAEELSLFVHVPAGIPLLSTPFQIASLASRFPSALFIMGNMGLNQYFWDAVKALTYYPNLILDTAGHVLSGEAMNGIRIAGEAAGFERIVFATDAPYFDPRIERMKIHLASLPEQVENLILGGNMERLLAPRTTAA